ncbi:hypothetical protein [Rhodoblastus sp.]|jgi:hypothetical protein|uniref:hypothetical protein n=1 Tax=Rhodoblastus sp. TaxID=1962975 RepID=UPI0025DCD0EB|nr:hypothetical protein [Rhodoblastus sp.]
MSADTDMVEVPLWMATALAIGQEQAARQARADATGQSEPIYMTTHGPLPKWKLNALGARILDPSPINTVRSDATPKAPEIDPEKLAKLADGLDALASRMDTLERVRAARVQADAGLAAEAQRVADTISADSETEGDDDPMTGYSGGDGDVLDPQGSSSFPDPDLAPVGGIAQGGLEAEADDYGVSRKGTAAPELVAH